MSTLSYRDKRKRETLARIEKAAWSLFKDKGYDATSTREVAERAEIAAGTLFNYFNEKRGLLFHILERRLGRIASEAVESCPGKNLLSDVEYVFSKLHHAYAEDRRLVRAFFKELFFMDGELRVASTNWTYSLLKEIEGMVESAKKRGEVVSSTTSATAARAFFSVHFLTSTAWLGGALPSTQARDAQMKESLALIYTGLSGSAG